MYNREVIVPSSNLFADTFCKNSLYNLIEDYVGVTGESKEWDYEVLPQEEISSTILQELANREFSYIMSLYNSLEDSDPDVPTFSEHAEDITNYLFENNIVKIKPNI